LMTGKALTSARKSAGVGFNLLGARCLDVLAFGDFHTWLVDERQRLASENFGTPPPRPVFAYFLQGISTGRRPAALRNLATLT
jgi:hypothetical protein